MPEHIYTSIEIAASPTEVRNQFLNLSNTSLYNSNSFIQSISPNPSTDTLIPNETILTVRLKPMTMKPVFLENSPATFRWRGSALGGGFVGEHVFRFEERDGGRSTLFVQEERFTGALTGPLIGEGWVSGLVGLRKKTVEGFEAFNKDLKRVCEEGGK